MQVIDFCYPRRSTKSTETARKNPEAKQTTLQRQTHTESARRAGRASGRPQGKAKSHRRRNAETKTAPPDPQRQRAGHGPATEKRKQSHLRRRGREAGNRPATRNDPEGHEPRRTPRGPNRRTGGPKGANNKRAPGGAKQLHGSGARLCREQQGREAPLGDN